MNNEDYKKYAEEHQPRSRTGLNMLKAFVVGGLICCIGEAISEFFAAHGLSPDDASSATCIVLIFIGAFLTGLGVYDRLAKFAGGGTLVPITGFANSVVSPALEFKTEGFITGTAAKMFIIAGPVIVFGIASSVVYGLILCLL